ncbi:MAG: FadR family transcriptional regulator [Proteobacteria bacterium]|nr:FadR family transcriptional regulator [Pseudomonadota bacterium]
MNRATGKNRRLYLQLAEKLADDIAAGRFAIGERLPPERELTTRYAISRATVREALIALETRGLVEVRQGSGVYVTAVPTTSGLPLPMDVDAFELSEARLLFEGEVVAQAAAQITDEQLDQLEALLDEMESANRRNHGEDADRRFHLAIAAATRNAAMIAVIESLWTIRLQSPKCVRLFGRSRRRGAKPVVDEHRAIVTALRARDARAARNAMRAHLQQVLDCLLDASEREALRETRAHIAAQRSRFAGARRRATA